MGIYATAAQLRTELGVDAAALPDADAERLLKAAERRLDRVAGPLVTRANGRKYDPATLPALESAAVRDATLILAVAAHRSDGDAFRGRDVKREAGPDFTLEFTDSGSRVNEEGEAALLEAVAELDRFGLRPLTATLR